MKSTPVGDRSQVSFELIFGKIVLLQEFENVITYLLGRRKRTPVNFC